MVGPILLAGVLLTSAGSWWLTAREQVTQATERPPSVERSDAPVPQPFDVSAQVTGPQAEPVAAPPPVARAAAPPAGQSATPARARLAPSLPRWLRLTRESGLWSAPEAGDEFTKAPQAATVRVLERQGARFRVHYPGDEETKRSGEAWLNAADAQEVAWPRFVRTRTQTALRAGPEESAPVVLSLPSRAYLEVLGTQGRDWGHVFLAARPDTGEPLEAWVDGEDVLATPRDPSEYLEYTLTRGLLQSRSPDAWLSVPYRTQLDGADYEAANCGPTVLWMSLRRQLTSLPSPGRLRSEVLSYQDMDECDDCGVFIEHLAAVAERHGVPTSGLFQPESTAFHRWTADEMRAQLRQGRVVVPQVMFRFLSGRERSDYWGDHYVVVTGFIGDRFIYHDPIDTRGPGSSRMIPAERLMKAMENSDFPYAAFALGG